MAVLWKSRTFAPSKHRKFQKLKDNKPSRRAARQHTWRAFFILGGSGIFVRDRLFLGLWVKIPQSDAFFFGRSF